MRLVQTATVLEGTLLGKAIYNDKGQILLNEGVKLERKLIKRLIEMGIHYIYIKDQKTEDLAICDPLSMKLKKKAMDSIEKHFLEIESGKDMSNVLALEKAAKNLKTLVREILFEIKSNQELLVLLSEVYTYDHYIFTHSLNVTMYSLAIGIKLNLPEKDLEVLGLGAILHDVGKMKIPEQILLKPDKLTKEEYEEVKKHAEVGFQILRKIPNVSLIVAHCAYQHHERLNGTGYPRGIKSKDIHYFGKIIAVADVFDAVTSNRVYRQAMLPHEGLEILYSGSETLFDKKIIEAFRQAVAVYPVGITVVLNDGRKGVVSKQNSGVSDRPVVRIIEENGMEVSPYEINLQAELDLMITACDTTFPKN
ncbi:HD-GYP domain-containing protein [Neobacillus sp. SM06]|uniref:HD-GYP domain-containing protein n=1 Tax=Neobacillus sp. SM06 TaxID=3422492 RepID=UPI003D2723F3